LVVVAVGDGFGLEFGELNKKVHASIGLSNILLVARRAEDFALNGDETNHHAVENLQAQVFDVCVEALVLLLAIDEAFE